MSAESRFRAMGSDVEVIVVGDPALLARAEERIGQLEARWSRFRPTSEISQLNERTGIPVVVSEETYALIELAVDATLATRGLFDPTVLHDVIDAGYDRTFEEIGSVAERPPAKDLRTGCGTIALDPVARCVSLPPGVGFDPGGIGKGYAADLVYEELLSFGARGACVNVGGDLRLGGEPPDERGWLVGVDHPFGWSTGLSVTLDDGALATSARTKRTWFLHGRPTHHLIDPRSGRPAATGLAGVTVVAREAWQAEVWAKAAFIAGRRAAAGLLEGQGLSGFLTADDGTVTPTADLLAPSAS
ncbi:MAG: FAD:protein FMN transferase [Actinomycetota bacterium]